MQNFKELIVYKEAYELSKDIFKDIKSSKNFRLKEQLFGSVTAIPANLAEMGAFESDKASQQKVRVCIGEANETEFWLDFCNDTGEITKEKHSDYTARITKIRKMLFNLLKSMKGE
ncbi:four helix bundle protein [Candidatus Woesearchaeota archaeon]|nr:four helix bundle protein [Candidatus Woesearchaeota archaeon]